MIKFVSEAEVDLFSPKASRKSRSVERAVEPKSSMVQSPEEGHSSTEALKELKKHNDQTALLKGRLSVLQIQEEKNDFRAYINEQRYQFHQQMRHQMEKQRQRKARHLRQVQHQIDQSHEQARLDRLEHQLNMKRVQHNLYSSKHYDYSSTKQKQREIETSLQQLKREQNDQKQSRYKEVKDYEKMQKSHVKEYLQNKKKEFQKSDNQEGMALSRVKDERVRQIDELSRLEAMMLERQARSKMGSEESQMRLKKLLHSKKPVSTSHTTKLPSLSEKRNTQQLFVL